MARTALPRAPAVATNLEGMASATSNRRGERAQGQNESSSWKGFHGNHSSKACTTADLGSESLAERLTSGIRAASPQIPDVDSCSHARRLVAAKPMWDACSMRCGRLAVAWMSLACFGCGASSASSDPASASRAVTGCEVGAPLLGASYDVTKSRFAFGSTPVRDDANGFVRWVGVDGVVAIEKSGGEIGSMNGGAPEASLPDWSNDPTALGMHVTAYFASFGVSACQVGGAPVNGGSGGRTITLVRSVDGIIIGESLAYARLDNQDQSTSEGFYWPTIPADVVTSARAFHARLADPTQLAAYKAKLPADAQGDGIVNLHHSGSSSTSPFAAAATYDVETPPSQLGRGSTLSFDADANPVSMAW
jgi:hypothetical protein